jgi:hypothetical protein
MIGSVISTLILFKKYETIIIISKLTHANGIMKPI